MPHAHGIFRAGTSGLVLREPNKQAFPDEHKQKTRLSYYATLFNTIEINSSFYKPPMPVTFTKWANMVPDDFQFTIKLWRNITHVRGFAFSAADVALFMKAASNLGRKKGCLLIQFPPSVTKARIQPLTNLLEEVRATGPGWKLAVEFRDKSWYNDNTYRLLDEHKATLVLHDMPSSLIHTPLDNSPFIYIRFHGVKGDYKGGYHRSHLEQYAERIRTWLRQGKDVYTYFNNTIGDAVANLETLISLVS
ncbi:MAG TPA: DUF72 domain-containing protein [Puia sp.]|nr:DUF72 domain-containing protein [Puia sp.]